jgi:ribosomal protein S18 acetylase RimI-like enzyme
MRREGETETFIWRCLFHPEWREFGFAPRQFRRSAAAPEILVMSYTVRQLSPSDQQVLWEMLYHSLYVAQGSPPFPPEVIERPEIAKYVEAWGRAGDLGFIAIDSSSNQPVGAVWLRLLRGDERGYGYVDDETPELGIAVLPGDRGRGVGSELLGRLLESAAADYHQVCLSVSADNPAVRLYERVGFEQIGACGASVTMVKRMIV